MLVSMTCPDTISELIKRFDYHRFSYVNGKEAYNETKLRQDYLDHFFIALGWDVYNKQGTVLQRQIETNDKAIDALVYELYGITEDEIKIIEGT